MKFSGQLFKTLYLSHTHLIPRVESITRKFSWIKLGISIVILTFRNKFWIWTFTINTISTSNIKDCSKRASILSWYSPNTKVILSEIMITLYFKLCCLVLVYISQIMFFYWFITLRKESIVYNMPPWTFIPMNSCIYIWNICLYFEPAGHSEVVFVIIQGH